MTLTTPTYTLGELMAKSRKDKSLDQAYMASALGIARNSVSNYETNRSVPPFDVVVLWAELTGVSLEWLAQGFMRRDYYNPKWITADDAEAVRQLGVNAEMAPSEDGTISDECTPSDLNREPTD